MNMLQILTRPELQDQEGEAWAELLIAAVKRWTQLSALRNAAVKREAEQDHLQTEPLKTSKNKTPVGAGNLNQLPIQTSRAYSTPYTDRGGGTRGGRGWQPHHRK